MLHHGGFCQPDPGWIWWLLPPPGQIEGVVPHGRGGRGLPPEAAVFLCWIGWDVRGGWMPGRRPRVVEVAASRQGPWLCCCLVVMAARVA